MEENKVNVMETEAPETSVQVEEKQSVTPFIECKKCGAALQEGQAFCPKCGQKVGEPVAKKPNRKKLIWVGAAAAVVVIAVLLVLVIGGIKPDFNKMYPELAGKTWCTIASDGSYMKIDTNPYDTDDDDQTYFDYVLYTKPADETIEQVNKDLGFSSALYEKMQHVTWSQGLQTESNDKYTVTYSYHPDKGLEVMYEVR